MELFDSNKKAKQCRQPPPTLLGYLTEYRKALPHLVFLIRRNDGLEHGRRLGRCRRT
jgi:hypothetical protein